MRGGGGRNVKRRWECKRERGSKLRGGEKRGEMILCGHQVASQRTTFGGKFTLYFNKLDGFKVVKNTLEKRWKCDVNKREFTPPTRVVCVKDGERVTESDRVNESSIRLPASYPATLCG